MGKKDDAFDIFFWAIIVTFMVGILVGAVLYWLYLIPYLPEFYPAMAHLFYVSGMAIFTIAIIIGYVLFPKDHYVLIFTALWLVIVGMWIMFAYGIYGVINIFLAWWGSNLSLNTGLIMWALSIICLATWMLITIYNISNNKHR